MGEGIENECYDCSSHNTMQSGDNLICYDCDAEFII